MTEQWKPINETTPSARRAESEMTEMGAYFHPLLAGLVMQASLFMVIKGKGSMSTASSLLRSWRPTTPGQM